MGDETTDDVSAETSLAARHDLYRRQVDTYAECWEALGERVARRILYLTMREEAVEW